MLLLLAHAALATSLNFTTVVPARSALRLGVIAGPTGTNGAPDLTARFHEFGIKYIRNNDYYDDRLDIVGILNCGGSTYPSWEGCDANDDRNYVWGPSDALMKAMKDGAFEPMLRLGGEWENHSKTHDFKGPQNSTQEANWIVAASKVATRYRGQYAYLDIWTEFPGPKFWDRDNDEFLPFWAQAYRAIKHAAPEARVGGPGFSGAATGQLAGGEQKGIARRFVKGLYEQKVRPDWIGWHLFTNDPAEYVQAGRAYRQLLDGTGEFSDVPWARDHFFAGVELVVDALGTTERLEKHEKVDPEIVRQLHEGARGASVLAASLIAIQSTDSTRAYWYRAGDLAPKAGKAAGSWLGLFAGDAAATPKKSAYAARLWGKFSSEYPVPVSVAQPSGEGVWAELASSAGGKAVFLANTSGSSVTVDRGGIHEGTPKTGWFVDEKRDGTAAEGLSDGRISLPPFGVALVVLQ